MLAGDNSQAYTELYVGKHLFLCQEGKLGRVVEKDYVFLKHYE